MKKALKGYLSKESVLPERGLNMQNLKDISKNTLFYNNGINRICEKPISEGNGKGYLQIKIKTLKSTMIGKIGQLAEFNCEILQTILACGLKFKKKMATGRRRFVCDVWNTRRHVLKECVYSHTFGILCSIKTTFFTRCY